MTVESRGVAPEAPVEGRWTLQRCNGCGRIAMGRHGTEWCFDTEQKEPQTSVPVVPCDDAAVGRGAEALVRLAARWGMGEWRLEGAREMVETVLRAAGNPDA